MQTTTNYALKKPDLTDPQKVADLNYNADIIDAQMKLNVNTAIVNGLTETVPGKVLDAVQGKILGELVSTNTGFPATNILVNGDFSSGNTGWGTTGVLTVVNGVANFTSNSSFGYINTVRTKQSDGDKIYIKGIIKSTGQGRVIIYDGMGNSIKNYIGDANYQKISFIHTQNSGATILDLRLEDTRSSGFDIIYIDNFLLINLTATFGAGNEPSLAEMDAIMALYPNSWFDGTVNPLLTSKQIVQFYLGQIRTIKLAIVANGGTI